MWMVAIAVFVAGCGAKKVPLQLDRASTEEVVRAYEDLTGYEYVGGPIPAGENQIGFEGEVTKEEGTKLLETMFMTLGTAVVRDDAAKTFELKGIGPAPALDGAAEVNTKDLPLLPVALPEKDIRELMRQRHVPEPPDLAAEPAHAGTNDRAVIREGLPQFPAAAPPSP